MAYFVLAYDRLKGAIVVGPEEFNDSSRALALRRRFELEARFRSEAGVEVVVLSADSKERIQETHGRYFKGVADLAAS